MKDNQTCVAMAAIDNQIEIIWGIATNSYANKIESRSD